MSWDIAAIPKMTLKKPNGAVASSEMENMPSAMRSTDHTVVIAHPEVRA